VWHVTIIYLKKTPGQAAHWGAISGELEDKAMPGRENGGEETMHTRQQRPIHKTIVASKTPEARWLCQ